MMTRAMNLKSKTRVTLEDYLRASLDRDAQGIYLAADRKDVSYPEGGNEQCAAVEDTSFWFQHRNNCLCEVVEQHNITGTFLDVGGGNGHVSLALQNHGLDCCLVEPSIEGCRIASSRGLQHIACSTLEAMSLPENSVDAIGMFDVIEHIEDPQPLLEESFRVLKDQGALLVTVPAFSWLWSNADVYAGHFRRYTRRSLATSLKNAGFSIERVGYFFSSLTLPVLLARTLPSLVRSARKIDDSRVQRDHSSNRGLTGKLIQSSLLREQSRMARGKLARIGTSCLAVARKDESLI